MVKKTGHHTRLGEGTMDSTALNDAFKAAQGKIALKEFTKPCRVEPSNEGFQRLDICFGSGAATVRVEKGLTPEQVGRVREAGNLDVLKAPQGLATGP